MKVIISASDSLPAGEYELTNREKLERAKNSIPFPKNERRILIEYDRLAGQIIKDGKTLSPQSLWNVEKNRTIEQHSNEEILEILRRAENTDISGSLYQKARNEWEQRQRQENLRQVNSLVCEIQELKDITKQTAENSKRDAKNSSKIAFIALGVAVISGYLQFQSNNLTRQGLELSSAPVLSISLDRRATVNDSDDVTIASGWLPAKDSILKLILTNHSISSVEDVEIRMTLWKFFVDSKSHHLNVCPFGYVYKKDNSTFKVENIFVHNVLDKYNVFSLQRNTEHPFTVDLSGLKNEKIDFKILLKIDVNFVKTAGKTSHSYIKLYVLNSLNQVIDVDIAPEFGLTLNDKKNEKDIDGFKFPSTVYPFQEKEFLNYFENPTTEFELQSNNCQEFALSKEQRVINY